MQKEVLLSVIIPVYNAEKYLSTCLNSIINQTYKNLEIILIDDASSDQSLQICDDFATKDTRIKIIHLHKNQGVSNARNTGLNIAKGSFIAFIDADDYLELNMFKRLIQKQIEQNSDIVMCRYYEIKANNKYKVYESKLKSFCKNNTLKLIYQYSERSKLNSNIKFVPDNIQAYLWRSIYRMDLIKNIKFHEDLSYMEDCLFLAELLKNKNIKIDLVDDYLYYHIIHSDSLSHSKTNFIDNNFNYVQQLSKSLDNTKYKDLILGLQFYCYRQTIIKQIINDEPINLEKIKTWGNYYCYHSHQKATHGVKLKVKNFLIYHQYYKLLKLLIKTK